MPTSGGGSVTWHRNTLVFVKMRVRQKSPDHHPLETITNQKQKRIGRAARWFLVKNWKKTQPDCRFDVVWFQADDCELADGRESSKVHSRRDRFYPYF